MTIIWRFLGTYRLKQLFKYLQAPARCRTQLAIYWVLLAVGSHWPRLELFPPAEHERVFQPDKGLHFLAFAGLAWLMIRAKIAGWRASDAWTAAAVGIVALGYAMIDELAQHWTARDVTLSDFTASAVGILTVVVIYTTPPRSKLPGWVVWTARILCVACTVIVLSLALPPSGNQTTQRLLGRFTATWGGIDKPCHFYVALGMTWLLALSCPAGVRRARAGALVTILAMGLSAPMLETAQGMTGRGIETADILAHELGFALALGIWALISTTRALLNPHTPITADG